MLNPALSRSSSWIVGPRYDLLFFSSVWVPPLLILAAYGALGLGLSIGFFSLWMFHLFVRLPHFGATLRVTYLRPENLAYYRQHWVLYFLIPAFIFALYSFPLSMESGYHSPAGRLLFVLAYIWGYQHIGMQNYGILQIYRRRAGTGSDLVGSRYEKIVFYAIIVSVATINHVVPWLNYFTGGRTVTVAASTSRSMFMVVLGVLVVLYVMHLVRTNTLSWPAFLYFIVSVVVMIQWPFYDALPSGSWFFVFNGHHSIAYLGLVFLMEWNRRAGGQPLRVLAGLRAYVRFILPLLVFSLALAVAVAFYHSLTSVGRFRLLDAYGMDLLVGFFVTHYYIEALVWKFSNPHNRATTLPLLRHPAEA